MDKANARWIWGVKYLKQTRCLPTTVYFLLDHKP